MSLVKDDAKKFIRFLTLHKEKAIFSDAQTFNLKNISRVYNLIDFKKLAKKFKDDPTLSSEEKETIEIFLKAYQAYKANK